MQEINQCIKCYRIVWCTQNANLPGSLDCPAMITLNKLDCAFLWQVDADDFV